MGAKEQGADATQGRWLVIPRTLCFVFNGGDVLLMKRAPHKRIFPNRYNGLGGHIERDEDPLTGARREILEEAGLDVPGLRLRAVYNIDTGGETGIALFVYAGHSPVRETRSDEREGTLHWIPLDQIRQYDLVEDIAIILPRIVGDDAVIHHVHVSYDANDQIMMQFAQDTSE
jgi:8-oxo-dGTP diphosphatase